MFLSSGDESIEFNVFEVFTVDSRILSEFCKRFAKAISYTCSQEHFRSNDLDFVFILAEGKGGAHVFFNPLGSTHSSFISCDFCLESVDQTTD